MKAYKIQASIRWCQEATFNTLRGIHARLLLLEMLKEIPAERQEYFSARIRGIDAHVRSLYYGPKVDNSNNTPQIAAHRGHT